jgi:hypothetical protein
MALVYSGHSPCRHVFILAPNLAQIFGTRCGRKKEQAHGDGIAVDYKPALTSFIGEFSAGRTIRKGQLTPHKPDKDSFRVSRHDPSRSAANGKDAIFPRTITDLLLPTL